MRMSVILNKSPPVNLLPHIRICLTRITKQYYFLTTKGTQIKEEKISEIQSFMKTLDKILSFHIKTQIT